MEGYEMAITPKEARDKRQDRDSKLVNQTADFFEERIDQSGRTHFWVSSRIGGSCYVDLLYENPSVREDLKQRYIRKGWKEVKIVFNEYLGDRDVTIELIE